MGGHGFPVWMIKNPKIKRLLIQLEFGLEKVSPVTACKSYLLSIFIVVKFFIFFAEDPFTICNTIKFDTIVNSLIWLRNRSLLLTKGAKLYWNGSSKSSFRSIILEK